VLDLLGLRLQMPSMESGGEGIRTGPFWVRFEFQNAPDTSAYWLEPTAEALRRSSARANSFEAIIADYFAGTSQRLKQNYGHVRPKSWNLTNQETEPTVENFPILDNFAASNTF
jgi:hypothetical protein